MKLKNSHIVLIVAAVLLVAGGADWYTFTHPDTTAKTENTLEENSARIAYDWISKSAPTYLYDGLDLVQETSGPGTCATCYELQFSFNSRHGGYGNRTGLIVTEAITPHSISIRVKDGVVVSALSDGRYNELTGALAE